MDVPVGVTNSPVIQLRLAGRSLNYIRVARQMTVSKSGYYSFQISSSFSVNALVYTDSFDASDPLLNLIAQSESGPDGQVKFNTYLQGANRLSKRVCIRMTNENYSLTFFPL